MKFLNKIFQLVPISITKWNFNQNEGFSFLNKLGGIVYDSSELFVDLIKSFMILLMNRDG